MTTRSTHPYITGGDTYPSVLISGPATAADVARVLIRETTGRPPGELTLEGVDLHHLPEAVAAIMTASGVPTTVDELAPGVHVGDRYFPLVLIDE